MKLALILAAAAVIYCAVALARPVHRCPRCHGRRVVVRKGKRPKPCDRCKGHGRVPRLGAAAIHRFFWSVRGEQLMQRRRDAHSREGD